MDDLEVVLKARLRVVDLVTELTQDPLTLVFNLDVFLDPLERLPTYWTQFLLCLVDTLNMFPHISHSLKFPTAASMGALHIPLPVHCPPVHTKVVFLH